MKNCCFLLVITCLFPRQGWQCQFNPCILFPNSCPDEKECILDPSTCQTSCEELPSSASVCPWFVECLHGVCLADDSDLGIRCECNAGWTGINCSDPLDSCTLVCEEGTRCEILDNLTQVCVASEDTTPLPVSTTIAAPTPPCAINVCNIIQSLCPVGTDCKPVNACMDNVCECRADSDIESCQECTRNGLCDHGQCITLSGNDTKTECRCEDNWYGPSCNITCGRCPSDRTCTPQYDDTYKCQSVHHPCHPDFQLRPLSDRHCTESNHTCQYGTCPESGDEDDLIFFCECDNDEDISDTCELGCPTEPTEPCVNGHFEPHVQNRSAHVCVCRLGWSGPDCSLPCNLACEDNETCIVYENMTEACIDLHNPCKPYFKQRNLTERKCIGGFQCKYGTCIQDGLQASCECDEGASGYISCENICCIECLNGLCFSLKGNQSCNCYSNFTGDLCDVPVADKFTVQAEATRTWYLWVVGVCAVVLLILMVMLVVMPYIMWRNRVILVMKIVHFFQGYEDDDEREWDAFVSYKADQVDEAFVLNTLYPKLEKEMGFKLHLHFKDFVPGDSIANNIIRAVKSSRRTILLVTPNFVKSEFTKFEYQVAQDEMLKYRHRIIPILLEDITDVRDNMDHNLKHILDSVTYIEWPGTENEKKLNRFWKRLELSLPKKRSEDRKSAAMAAPEDIEVSVITDQRSNGIESQFELKETEPIRMSNGTTIFDDGEVYDTINDDDVKTQVLKKNKMNSQNGGDNIGNGNHCGKESFC